MVVVTAIQRLFQERLHLLVKVLTDGYCLGLGNAALSYQHLYPGIDLSARVHADKGLDEYGIEGLVG